MRPSPRFRHAPALALLAAAVLAPLGAHADPPRAQPTTPSASPADIRPTASSTPPSSAIDVPLPTYADAPPRDPRAQQVIDHTAPYLREMERDAFPSYVAGSPQYYRRVAQDVEHGWHPLSTDAPAIGETLVNNLFAPTDVALNISHLSQGPFSGGRVGAAADALDAAHPNSPMLLPRNTGSAIAEATAHITRAVLEVDQDARGRVVAVRVERSSGYRRFDANAVASVRATLAAADPVAMPGGWRSRWEFVVIDTRDPALVALPGLPGEMPAITPGWLEVTDDGELHHALRAHRHERVRVLSSERLDGAR